MPPRSPRPKSCATNKRLLTAASGRGNFIGQSEIDVDLGDDFDGVAVEQRGLIDPRLHGIDGRRDEQRMPADHFEVDDGAVFADDGLQVDYAGNARMLGEWWIRGTGL